MSYQYPSYPHFMPPQSVQPPSQHPQMMPQSFNMVPPMMPTLMPQYVPIPVLMSQLQPQFQPTQESQPNRNTRRKYGVKRLQRNVKPMSRRQVEPAKKRLKLNVYHRTYNSVVDTNRQMSAVNVSLATFALDNRPPVINDIINVPITIGDRTETIPCVVAPNQEEKIIIGIQVLNIFNMKLDLSPKDPIHSRLGQRKYRNDRSKGGRKRSRDPRIGNREPMNIFYPGNQGHQENYDVLDIHVQPEDENLMGFDEM